MIDLHTHSTESDGTLSPSELVDAAVHMNLTALALTDHDTVSGIEEARSAARDKPLEFIPGVEISANVDVGSLHIVGLFVDHENPALLEALDYLVNGRNRRNQIIIDNLKKIGFEIELSDIEKIATGRSIGRPHFAEAMIEKGYVASLESAFKKYLNKGKPAYAPKEKLDRKQAIEVILKAGGTPILAHPDQTKKRGLGLESLVRELTDLGLQGIEAYCSGYSTYDNQELTSLAKKMGLKISGGSDFHGGIKPGIELGVGPGGLHVPDSLLGPLKEVLIRR